MFNSLILQINKPKALTQSYTEPWTHRLPSWAVLFLMHRLFSLFNSNEPVEKESGQILKVDGF